MEAWVASSVVRRDLRVVRIMRIERGARTRRMLVVTCYNTCVYDLHYLP